MEASGSFVLGVLALVRIPAGFSAWSSDLDPNSHDCPPVD
jgi:hypothetical protein